MSKFLLMVWLAVLAGTIALAAPPEVVMVNGAALVPLRTVAKWLGATTQYDAKTASTSITWAKHVVKVTLNKTSATVDGKAMTLPAAPCQKSDTTYVPLRLIASSFGVKTGWDAKTQTATLIHPVSGEKLALSINPKKPLDPMPLFQAIATGDEATTTKLLTATPALLTLKGSQGETATFVAAITGQLAILKMLETKGADLNVLLGAVPEGDSSMTGASLLHAAAMSGKLDVVEYLVGKGQDVNAVTKLGFTPLLVACGRGDTPIVTYLLDHGADVKVKANLPESALADPKTKELSTKAGFATALMFAFGRKEVEDLLTKHGAPALDPDLVKELTAMREKNKQSQCMSEMRQIAVMAVMYSREHDGKLPDAAGFWKTLAPSAQLMICPDKPDQPNGFGFNKALGGVAFAKIGNPEKVIFLADGKTDIITTPDDIDRTRHGDGFCAVFCDGHMEFLKSDTEVTLVPTEAAPKVPPQPTTPPEATKHAVIKTAKGDIEVELYGKDAPITVDNFVKLAEKHFYKDLTFHRVEMAPDFRLIQGGDPKGDGSGGPGYSIKLEISPKLRHVKGAIAMARSDAPDSAGCQFYICIGDIPQLDDRYAVFGKVTSGLDVAGKIVKGDKIIDIEIK